MDVGKPGAHLPHQAEDRGRIARDLLQEVRQAALGQRHGIPDPFIRGLSLAQDPNHVRVIKVLKKAEFPAEAANGFGVENRDIMQDLHRDQTTPTLLVRRPEHVGETAAADLLFQDEAAAERLGSNAGRWPPGR